jgi:PRC-barrel domain
MDHPLPGLTYVPINELDGSKLKFENFAVEDPAGEKLGTLEGFIIDVGYATPYYLVVKAGSWFRSKHVLIPIGHAALDTASRRIVGDVPKERVKRFPGFDLDLFPKLTQNDLDRMAEEIGRVCCPNHVVEPTAMVSVFEQWAHYETPTWWDRDFYKRERSEERPESMAGTTKR